jgi:hypothetical protein
MSNDSEHRNSPPDFGDEDSKDDDQMFKSATLPVTDDIPLSGEDDDDENPFGEPAVQKKTPTNTIEPSTNNSTPLTVPPVTPIAVPEPQPPTPVKQDTKLFPSDSGINATQINTSATEPARSTTSFESQLSASKPISSETAGITTNGKSAQKRSDDHNIEITVSDPTKVGEVCIY